ncbi:MAG: hypothetical protein FWF41_05520 [Betaproteobacteria bacterium]|nr:hypothetical protein [Betaproteobacteria bacterium]
MDKKTTLNPPQNLTAPVAFSALATFAAKEGEQKDRKFSGVAYGGGVITDHPFLDAVVFDLASTQFNTPAPALYGHSKPVGVIEAAVLSGNITISGSLFSDICDEARQISDTADRGMPWQMSVGIWPGSLERVNAGRRVMVNGQEFTGPLTVFRNNRIRETSFVALGADHSTSAAFFAVSEGGKRPPTISETNPEGVISMDQAEHDAIVAAKDAKIAELEAQVSALNEKFSARQKETRTKSVREMFAALGREWTDDAAEPYIAMSEEAFAAVSKDMLAVKPKPAGDKSLFSSTANDGQDAGETAEHLAQRIREYVASEAQKGNTVSFAAAANHLKNTQE